MRGKEDPCIKEDLPPYPNCLEIPVTAGINNNGQGRRLTISSGKWKSASYAAFCTVILAPKYCTLYVHPSPPEPEVARWVPGPNFRDHYKVIKSLYDGIIELNKKENLKFVRLDYHGVKSFKSGTVHKARLHPSVEGD